MATLIQRVMSLEKLTKQMWDRIYQLEEQITIEESDETDENTIQEEEEEEDDEYIVVIKTKLGKPKFLQYIGHGCHSWSSYINEAEKFTSKDYALESIKIELPPIPKGWSEAVVVKATNFLDKEVEVNS